MAKHICNADAKIKASPTTVPPDAVYGGDFGITRNGITAIKSSKVKLSDKAMLLQSIVAVWSAAMPCPFTSALYTFTAGGGSISATAGKVKGTQMPAMLKDDSGNCMGAWVQNSSGAPFPCSCTLKMQDAGQEKVKGE